MKNIETFNELTGWIFAKIYQSHPLKITLKLEEVPDAITEKIRSIYADDRDYRKFWHHTVTWLRDEGFLTVGSKALNTTDFGSVALTMLGFAALNAVPESLKSKASLGEQLVAEMKDSGREVRGAVIAELVGYVFGGLAKSVGSVG